MRVLFEKNRVFPEKPSEIIQCPGSGVADAASCIKLFLFIGNFDIITQITDRPEVDI